MAKHRAVAIPGHQNCPFMRLRVRSLPWYPAFQWHMLIATCLLFNGTMNTGMVPTFPGGVVLKVVPFLEVLFPQAVCSAIGFRSFSSQKVLQFDSVVSW